MDQKDFEYYVRRNVIGPMQNSKLVVSIVPASGCDIKFAVELGLAIMLKKPIIAVVRPGAEFPAKLAAVVDRFVEGDISDPTFTPRLTTAIREVCEPSDY